MLREKLEDIALSNWTGWINKWLFFMGNRKEGLQWK